MSDPTTVQVAVRIRPLVASEASMGCKDVLDIYSDINQIRLQNSEKAFTFNQVFGSASLHEEVYNRTVKALVQKIFDGYNVTILAYGQTGSGKTFTMGTTYAGQGDMGVIPRAIEDIFQTVKDNFSYDFTVKVSFLELYQETLYDLLSQRPREENALEIREDSKGILIPGLTEIEVDSAQAVLQLLRRGSAGRSTSSTNMNAQSSRSHAIFTVIVVMQGRHNPNENKTSKFHFVDLAGSERSKKTGAVGTTFKEGVNINRGLLALGNVISALGDDKPHTFIPYRDSSLTRLLKDSLGGNSFTLMIACVSPADYNLEETLSTLRYADRAKKIHNKPIVNQDPKAAEIGNLKKIIRNLQLQIVGQGGAVVCPAELELLKKDNHDLRGKIRELTLQLSSTLGDNMHCMEKIAILHEANEKLHQKIRELNEDYSCTLNDISAGFDGEDRAALIEGISKLQKIQNQFVEITGEQKRTEEEISRHERDIQTGSGSDMTEDQEVFANKQIALNSQLQEISRQLAVKQHLANQIEINSKLMVDYKALAEYEGKIDALEREKQELMQQLKNQTSSNKVRRVRELETQIQALTKKVQEQARLRSLKERDEAKIRQLNNEIVQMKQAKVRLFKQMKEESEGFRAWKTARERELYKLKQEDQKKKNQIAKMAAMHTKQQTVLKRKVEHAEALNKRLKETLALRNNVHESRMGKAERVGPWMTREFGVYTDLVEAGVTLEGLMEDRATLQKQLDGLREAEEQDVEEIRQLEEDVELRSVQIQDLQQKILDSDEDSRSKTRFDNIQTVSEAKTALRTLLELSGNIMKNSVLNRNKIMELQDGHAELNEKIKVLEATNALTELRYQGELSEHEQKVAVLLRQLRGIQPEGATLDEEMKKRCLIQEERIDELDKQNQELLEKVYEAQKKEEELTNVISTVSLAQGGHIDIKEARDVDESGDNFRTPEPIAKRKIKVKRELDSTFTMEEDQINDLDVDDLQKDPDWRMTPVGKWLMAEKRKGETSKRTSDGSCLCQKSNCSRRCGCRRTNTACSDSCKCSQETCTNRSAVEKVSESGEDSQMKRQSCSLSRCRKTR